MTDRLFFFMLADIIIIISFLPIIFIDIPEIWTLAGLAILQNQSGMLSILIFMWHMNSSG